MNSYLVFNSKVFADAALEVIYANMVRAVESASLLNVETQTMVPKSELTSSEAVKLDSNDRFYPIFGINAATGQKSISSGFTKSWAVSEHRLTDDKWFFLKPADALMDGVAGFVIEQFQPAPVQYAETL